MSAAANELAGNAVVVTGAGAGLGRAIALAFAAEGARVVVAERDEKSGEETLRQIEKRGGGGSFVKTDVAREGEVAAAVEKALALAPRLAVFVNNAGVIGTWAPLVDQTEATLDAVLAVNVKGVVFGIKHAGRVMARQRSGVIVNLASVQGFRVVYPGSSFYAASKAAVVQLTKAAALELGPAGVRVVGIAPGPIDTPMLRGAVTEWPPAIVANVPLGRVGEPDDVARTIVWLASPAAAYITGATLPVDGGFLAP
ncbi:MAG TPA: SDR family NAD(P)-dependent oxidoreductase [Myxococcota bacterium]|nr:SDR family NAD(P)-dependent oxidoreductase [Myxococcota bacterium]